MGHPVYYFLLSAHIFSWTQVQQTSEITYVYWQVQQVFNFFYSVTLKDVNFELGVKMSLLITRKLRRISMTNINL